jgi:predicted transcriptional regulator
MSTKAKDKLTAARLTTDQMKTLKRIAEREDRSVSWLIRKAIDQFIEADKDKK